MKKLITTLFVVAVNFYFACFALGIAAGLYTADQGPIPQLAGLFIPVAALLLCLLYQASRRHFPFFSPGELVVGNSSKTDLLAHHTTFSISRIPVFLLLLVTVALPGNLLDGLSEGSSFTLPQLFSLSLVYRCFYRGLVRFFSYPSFPAAALLAVGLLLSAFLAYLSGPAGTVGAYVFLSLAILWIVAWAVYRRFRLPSFISA